jgi:hypothetical protein
MEHRARITLLLVCAIALAALSAVLAFWASGGLIPSQRERCEEEGGLWVQVDSNEGACITASTLDLDLSDG